MSRASLQRWQLKGRCGGAVRRQLRQLSERTLRHHEWQLRRQRLVDLQVR